MEELRAKAYEFFIPVIAKLKHGAKIRFNSN